MVNICALKTTSPNHYMWNNKYINDSISRKTLIKNESNFYVYNILIYSIYYIDKLCIFICDKLDNVQNQCHQTATGNT